MLDSKNQVRAGRNRQVMIEPRGVRCGRRNRNQQSTTRCADRQHDERSGHLSFSGVLRSIRIIHPDVEIRAAL